MGKAKRRSEIEGINMLECDDENIRDASEEKLERVGAQIRRGAKRQSGDLDHLQSDLLGSHDDKNDEDQRS